MKLENVKVGTKVRVKLQQSDSTTRFYSRYCGVVGIIISPPDEDYDVKVEFSDGTTDFGHHSNLKRIKEKHS